MSARGRWTREKLSATSNELISMVIIRYENANKNSMLCVFVFYQVDHESNCTVEQLVEIDTLKTRGKIPLPSKSSCTNSTEKKKEKKEKKRNSSSK